MALSKLIKSPNSPLSLFLRLLSSSSSQNPNPTPSSPWLHHWDPPPSTPTPRPPPGPIDRIVHRLQSLIQELDDEEDQLPQKGDLLQRSWIRPDQPVEPDCDEEVEIGRKRKKMTRVRGPTMAELAMEGEELRRVRRLGMELKERISVPKAGLTGEVMEKIEEGWGKGEVVRLRFHEDLKGDMKTAHEIVERRTGGLVIWRSGSVMVVYRGSNYKQPSRSQLLGDPLSEADDNCDLSSTPDKTNPLQADLQYKESMTEEEKEWDCLLDELGPRFVDWWGAGLLPVDADLLPESIPGYETPLRLLPAGMRSRLSNTDMTNLRKLSKKLPCHFALGRNRHHQGLAAAILKLWEKCLVAKIAVKQGLQNTNNKLMAEELKKLTGGILLLRNKFYIVIYRGKDFVPTAVASALVDTQGLAKDIEEVEETAHSIVGESSFDGQEGHALASTLAEFQEAQARLGRKVTTDKHKETEEASRSDAARLFKRTENKLFIGEAKMLEAERLLSRIEASLVSVIPSDDQEIITDQERSVFRKTGLRMKSYLPLGNRGGFDHVIENIHLHWKHKELVKLISKQKTLSFVDGMARLLEYESGGILVAIERIPKGFALIYYRGKNYERPFCLRSRHLLTKAKTFRHLVAMQRHVALHQYMKELESTIKQMKSKLEGKRQQYRFNLAIPQNSVRCKGLQ